MTLCFFFSVAYSRLHSAAFILHKLFLTSSDEFRKQRTTMKPSISNFVRKLNDRDSSDSDDRSIFQQLSAKTVIGYIKDDLLHRTVIFMPNMFWLLKGMICRTKSYKRYRKLLRRSEDKINAELDILNLIKSIRQMNASTFGQVRSRHRKLIDHMSLTMLSEYSSSHSEEPPDKNQIQEKDLDFVDEIVESPSDSDLRYLKYYEKLDAKRTASWLKSKPQNLTSKNLERLRYLIRQNLIKRVKSQAQEMSLQAVEIEMDSDATMCVPTISASASKSGRPDSPRKKSEFE